MYIRMYIKLDLWRGAIDEGSINCKMRRTCRQNRLYETLFLTLIILSKHHHDHHHQEEIMIIDILSNHGVINTNI
jgi:hypothetical protein